ncbi:hypothetical protein AHF37_00349 [Paragonimus kellicotti]|nr:hypothetical protein AHF37_00349 [Paragonimus kellicotti]
MRYCHDNNIIHRDLKPHCVILANQENSAPVKLSGFGLAVHMDPNANEIAGDTPLTVDQEIFVSLRSDQCGEACYLQFRSVACCVAYFLPFQGAILAAVSSTKWASFYTDADGGSSEGILDEDDEVTSSAVSAILDSLEEMQCLTECSEKDADLFQSVFEDEHLHCLLEVSLICIGVLVCQCFVHLQLAPI